jgi:superfamily II DNA/RNA helicase
VQHAHDLAATFQAAGISAAAIDGGTPKNERDEIVAQYKEGHIQVLSNCQVVTEGFDAPGTHGILMARPTKSTPLYIQMLGRGTRTMPAPIGNMPTKPGRLKAIEESVKPRMTLIDFADIAGNHEIVRAPNLFGLSSDFETEGGQRMVQDTVERVEEMIEENPYKEEEIRDAATFEEMEVEASRITVFDIADTKEEVKEISDYRWMHMGVGSYQLSVPADRQFDVRLEENELGHWDCTMHFPTQYVGEGADRTKIQGETFERNSSYEALEGAIQDVDGRVRREHGDINKILQHTASWHGESATRGQKGFLDRLNVDYPSDISKGDASALIDAKKALLRRE